MSREAIAWIVALTSVVALGLVSTISNPQEAGSFSPTPVTFPTSREDPAVLHREILSRLDSRIDELATQCRLEVRLALNEVLPVPYLGVDTEATPVGLRLIAVYADTGAERCGLRTGDVIRTFAGSRTDTKALLARAVRGHEVGEPVEIHLVRDGEPLVLTAVLGARPEEDEDEDEQFPDLVTPPAPLPGPRTLDFDDAAGGTLPSSLEIALGGHGRPPLWRIVRSGDGGVLRQDDPDPTGIRFPIVLLRDWSAGDATARVRFRYAGGRVDRTAGIVLRYRDPGNYLVARANALEGDLRIFRVVNGDRRTLPGAVTRADLDDAEWHVLEFRAEGAKLTALLDGEVEASSYDTFFLGGRAGLWTKSDSLTEFDDWSLEARK